MLIDWFTVGAQALNFIFLIWLMKKFLYQPVLNAIAAREMRIAAQLADAAAKQAQAAADRKTFEDKNAAFDQERAGLMDKALEDAKAAGVRRAGEVQEAADALATRRQQALATQAAQLDQLIASRAANEVFAVARKALADLASASLEDRMIDVFMRRLGERGGPAKDQLRTALSQVGEPALVRTRFELSAGQQADIRKAINEAFSCDAPVRFETAADAVCGIELSAGGQKLGWTISEYLRHLENEVAALLAPAARVATAASAAAAVSP